jgi:hypothetical protein
MEYNYYNIIINSSNVALNDNTAFKYNFPVALHIPESSEICGSKILFPYSFFNINTTRYSNNTFSYIWAGTQYDVVIPDGYYDVTAINTFLQQYMISQNQYLTNSATGLNYYFIVLVQNATYYTNQFLLFPIPTSLPSGYSAPSGFPYSTDGKIPQIKIIKQGFGNLIGYLTGSYPTILTTTATSIIGNKTPNITPVNSLVLRCNLVNNPMANPNDIMDSFNIQGTSFGSNITYNPFFQQWVTLKVGTFNYFEFVVNDQNINVIESRDANVLINLVLRIPKQKASEVAVANRNQLLEQIKQPNPAVKKMDKINFLE